jgi:hypothetical protein
MADLLIHFLVGVAWAGSIYCTLMAFVLGFAILRPTRTYTAQHAFALERELRRHLMYLVLWYLWLATYYLYG